MKRFLICAVALSLLVPATFAMAQQANVGPVLVGQSSKVEVNNAAPTTSLTFEGSTSAPAPQYIQPSQIPPLPSGVGLPTPSFTQLPVGSNVPSIVREVFAMREVFVSKAQYMLQKAGGGGRLLLNSNTAWGDINLSDINAAKEILVLPGMPLVLPVAESFTMKGITPDTINKKKEPVATTNQCLYAGIVYGSAGSQPNSRRVLVVESMGFDSGTRSDVGSRMFGFVFGGGQAGAGVTGSFGFGQRRDGASYRVEVDPYVHFSTYEVSEKQYKYLKEWQMANMRAIQAGEMQKMAAPAKTSAVSEAEAILNLTEAIKGATAVLEKTQIDKLKAAATVTKK